MFRGRSDRPANEDPRASNMTTTPTSVSRSAPGTSDTVAVPATTEAPAMIRNDAPEQSVVARDDRFEGTLRSTRGLRVLGQFQGHIEATASVVIEQGARVDADLTTDEAIVAGEYSGKLICRQRLELRSTGLIKGEIETVRLMLHEGGFIDGELHMQRLEAVRAPEADSVRGGGAARAPSVEIARDTVPSGGSEGPR
jgi:cytoskeletal protein CcmA (bactofilin family)